jgi:hypothetical protein
MNLKTNDMTKELTPLPEWFDGQVYPCGSEVTNPFSGYSYALNATELSMYDFIIGCNSLIESGSLNNKLINEFRKGLTWFRRVNPEAYMALLD